MQRPKILLDIDGVCADFVGAGLKALATLGIHKRPEDVTSYKMQHALGLTEEQTRAWFAMIREPGYCANIPLYDGAREGVDQLRKIGDVYAVTARFRGMPYWVEEREEWLHQHLDFDPRAEVIFTDAKHCIRGDVLIEDTTSTLVRWKQEYPRSLGLRIQRPYNESEVYDEGPTINAGRLTTTAAIVDHYCYILYGLRRRCDRW